MPTISKVLTQEELKTEKPRATMDLAPYREIISTVASEGGVGANVELEPGESQRTEKRRLSLAAKEEGYSLVWRKADDGHLRFVLHKEGEPVPGGRKKKEQVVEEPVAEEPPKRQPHKKKSE